LKKELQEFRSCRSWRRRWWREPFQANRMLF
jgi:hypothetical protein